MPPPAPKRSWWKRKRVLIPAGVLVLIILISSLSGGRKTDQSATPVEATAPAASAGSTTVPSQAPTAFKTPAPASKFGNQPAGETAFIAEFTKAKAGLGTAENDLQRTKLVADRDLAMCAANGGGAVREWAGKITKIGSTNDGYAYVDIRISDDVLVHTWNNALSDLKDETLVKPGPLYDSILKLKEGQTVVFSGAFLPGEGSCLKGTNLTKTFYAVNPDFLFKFSDIRPQ